MVLGADDGKEPQPPVMPGDWSFDYDQDRTSVKASLVRLELLVRRSSSLR